MTTPARSIDRSVDNLILDHSVPSSAFPGKVSNNGGLKKFTGTGSSEVELLLRQIKARETERRGSNHMNLLDGTGQCNLDSCVEGARITLGGEPFCINHFILRCYDHLDQLDPRIRNRQDEISELSNLRESIEECSNRALLISLRSEFLSNLDRSRLLDILLWSSDLLFLLNISARDFDLLAAFRQDSELTAPSDLSLQPSGSKQTSGKGTQNL